MSIKKRDGDNNDTTGTPNEEELQHLASTLPPEDDSFVDSDIFFQEAAKQAEADIISITKQRDATEEGRARLRKDIPDIVARAKALARQYPPDFKEVKSATSGGVLVTVALTTDTNIMAVFECLFGSGEGRPHFDTFKGLTVGWDGKVIDDDFNLQPILDSLIAFKLGGCTFEKIEKLFKRFARLKRVNSLVKRLNEVIPTWDNVPRIDDYIIRLFGSFDTPLSRDFCKYFWLSIYNRAMHPGCNAPMVLALFGTQGAGKSYFGKLIAEEMLGDEDADSVGLDWGRDFNDFLRQITGHSTIANVAEMAGFGRADLMKIKSLTTRTTDIMNYKFERDNKQSRQWVMVMDGNEYAGLQRDETGNRRFYPMFVGQLPFDSHNQVVWRDDYRVDFTTFRVDFWQLMAECSEWMDKHGMHGYNKHIAEVEQRVKLFSDEEMRNDRGTVRDDDLEMYVSRALVWCDPMFFIRGAAHIGAGRPTEKNGAAIAFADLRNAIGVASNRQCRVISNHLKTKITAFGARLEKINGERVFFWEDVTTKEEWEIVLIREMGEMFYHYKRNREKMDRDEF